MAGGSATNAGIAYQNEVGAYIATHILASAPVDAFDLPTGAVPTSFEMETSAPVDDILVRTSKDGFCFINVKRGVSLANTPESPLASVVDQFVRLWVSCKTGKSERPWQRPLDPLRDRMLLVTTGTRSASFVSAAKQLLGHLADESYLDGTHGERTQQELRVYATLKQLIEAASLRHLGEALGIAEIDQLLRTVRVCALDPSGSDHSHIISLLQVGVLADLKHSERAWTDLKAETARLATTRGGADRSKLRQLLLEREIKLRGISEYASDVEQLRLATEDTLASLAHLAKIYVPELCEKPIEIVREVTNSLVMHAARTSFLVVGAPGAGKSGSLFSAAGRLREEGHEVVALAVDQHPVNTLDELRRDLALEHTLVDLLSNWTTTKRGVLIIDALDASRGGPSDKVFLDLIRSVLQRAPNWSIVASIRVFDLRFGVRYRDLFHGLPIDPAFADPDFPDVRHLCIPALTDAELAQVWTSAPELRALYKAGTENLRRLLHSAYNLFLMANIFGDNKALKAISSQVELLHLYWAHRVIGNDQRGLAREALLRSVLNQMLELGTLQVPIEKDVALSAAEDLYKLNSDGVLLPIAKRRDSLSRVAFAHHVLFDYAVARLAFDEGNVDDFLGLLNASEDRALLIAPGAMMALQMLWEEDSEGRPTFWTKALEIASSTNSGAFCRMLPARVAAGLTKDIVDFRVPLTWLRTSENGARSGLLFLVRHCIGALSLQANPKNSKELDIGPWPAIARGLVETAIQDVGWMVKPLVAQWIEAPAGLDIADAADVNVISREILEFGSGARYDHSLVIYGIQGTARTFEVAPQESEAAFSKLLEPSHVEAHGFEELFWLAGELKYLFIEVPRASQTIQEIYRATYCTPLPSKDEKTSIGGSRILPLVSNKRQDFESARHILSGSFAKFFEMDPIHATGTLIEIVGCSKREERSGSKETIDIRCGGKAVRYTPDYSSMWAHHDWDDLPLQAFEAGLVSLAERGGSDVDAVLDSIFTNNSLAAVWAALLRAASKQPQVLGVRIASLLTARPFLEGFDTRKAAGDLISALHPFLGPSERAEVERTILETNEHSRDILLGCLPKDSIALREAREKRDELESAQKLPANREPVSVTGGAYALDDGWWLKEQGVDLEDSENKRLNERIKLLQASVKARETTADGPLSTQEWEQVQELHKSLRAHPETPSALLLSAWGVLTEAAKLVAENCKDSEGLSKYADISSIVDEAIANDSWTPKQRNAETEASFAKFPSWGSPAPRVEAAAAIMSIARALGSPNDALREKIELLARDPYPAVRLQILSRANALFDADPATMSKLIEIGFTEEKNEGVIHFFLRAVDRVLHLDPNTFSDYLLDLDTKTVSSGQRSEYIHAIVSLILRLWLVHDNQNAGSRVADWLRDPLQHAARIKEALPSLRSALLQGDPVSETEADRRIRIRSISLFEEVVLKLSKKFTELAVKDELTEQERAHLEESLRILDEAAREIYFGTGAYDGTKANKREEDQIATSSEIRKRALSELNRTLSELARVPYPSVTHHLLETLQFFIPDAPAEIFRLVTDCLLEGGRTGGYHFESLGADLFVDIVRRYLADYRSLLTTDPVLLDRLMRSLDVFVDVGWPEARRLVYTLPEMLR